MKATVFVVDDDRSLRQGLARIIGSAGWNVEPFASARAFLERADHTGTGCVTMDLSMPEVLVRHAADEDGTKVQLAR